LERIETLARMPPALGHELINQLVDTDNRHGIASAKAIWPSKP
jgi:hypothetical protein